MNPIRVTLLIVLALLSAQSLQAATATIERLAGTPKIFEIGETGVREVSLPRKGATYRLPIEVETGPDDSALFRLPDSEVSVAPDSIMRINAPESRASGLFQRILQKAGSSFFSVERRSVEHFEVQTPYLVSVVKGTMFNVTVHEKGATVALHEGRLLVTNPDGSQSVDLRPGDVAYSTEDGEVRKIAVTMARQPDASAPASEAGSPAGGGQAVTASGPGTGHSDLDAIAQVDDVNPVETATLDDGLADGLDAAAGTVDLETGAGGLLGEVGDAGGSAGDLVAGAGASTGDLVAGAGVSAGDLVSGAGAMAGGLVSDVGAGAGELAGALAPPAGDLVTGITETAGDLAADVGDSTGELLVDVSGGSGDLLADLGATTGDLLGDTGSAGALEDGVEETLEALTDGGLEDLGGRLPGLFP